MTATATATTVAPRDPMRTPVLASGAAIACAIAIVGAVRWSGVPIAEPDAPALVSRSLQFDDRPDGGLDVVDARTHRVVETIVGQAGFVRGTLRGLARERHRSGGGPTAPFELVAHTDGRLTLLDPATARRVDLESFGPTNMTAFARLLQDAPSPLAQRK